MRSGKKQRNLSRVWGQMDGLSYSVTFVTVCDQGSWSIIGRGEPMPRRSDVIDQHLTISVIDVAFPLHCFCQDSLIFPAKAPILNRPADLWAVAE